MHSSLLRVSFRSLPGYARLCSNTTLWWSDIIKTASFCWKLSLLLKPLLSLLAGYPALIVVSYLILPGLQGLSEQECGCIISPLHRWETENPRLTWILEQLNMIPAAMYTLRHLCSLVASLVKAMQYFGNLDSEKPVFFKSVSAAVSDIHANKVRQVSRPAAVIRKIRM